MARPKLSKEKKALKGTLRPCREKESPEIFPLLQKMPPAPTELKKSGRALWQKLGNQLIEAGTLTNVDLHAFTALCVSVDDAELLKNELCNGKTLSKGIKENPGLYRAYKFSCEYSRKLFQEFGLTPKSRNNISTAPPKKELDPDTKKMRELLGGL